MLVKRHTARGLTGIVVMSAFCGALTASTCLGQDRTLQGAAADVALKAFLRDYLKSGNGEFDRTTRYSAVYAKLSAGAEAPETVVYVSGRYWCGSGGCRMLILKPEGASFRVIARTTITWPPIRVLHTTTNGWHDVGVWVQGGGIQPGYTALLPFDGKAYASNPSVPPARYATGDLGGVIVIPKSEEGLPLYP